MKIMRYILAGLTVLYSISWYSFESGRQDIVKELNNSPIEITKKDINNDGLKDIIISSKQIKSLSIMGKYLVSSELKLRQIQYGIIDQDSLKYLTKEQIKELNLVKLEEAIKKYE